MAYFPAFIKLDGRKVLIVGGGKIASEKLEKILDFTSDVSIITPKLSSKMQILIKNNDLYFEKRVYKKGDIYGFNIVIIAVDNIEIQKSIYEESRNRGVLCNSVDSINYCDFIFPSYIKDGDLTIAISTSGASPSVSKYLKKFFLKNIPLSLPQFLKEMKHLRVNLPKGKERMKLLDTKAKNYFEKLNKY
jgi:precorrin-2 dehydrogenase/sirohydrochlorin ferrochelatase